VVYASSIVDRFGVELFPRLYPLCFLGYGLAALVGPPIGGWIADAGDSYIPAVALSAAMVLMAVPLIAFFFRQRIACAAE
jgi:OFA family oxalate/formate antiporter-like MFS transporter